MGMCVWFLQSLSTNTAVVGKEGEVGGVVGGRGKWEEWWGRGKWEVTIELE